MYDFQNDGVADHMGIVEAVSESALVVIEGNTGANGEVRRKDNLSPTYKGIMGYVIGGKPH